MSTKEISTGSTTSRSSSSASSSKVPSASTNVVRKSSSYKHKKLVATPTAKFGETKVEKMSYVESIPMSVRAIIMISLVVGGIALYFHLTKQKDEKKADENEEEDEKDEDEERHVRFENAPLTDPYEEDVQPLDESMDLQQTP